MNNKNIVKSCDNCANKAHCKKSIGYMFNFCNTDFVPADKPDQIRKGGE